MASGVYAISGPFKHIKEWLEMLILDANSIASAKNVPTHWRKAAIALRQDLLQIYGNFVHALEEPNNE